LEKRQRLQKAQVQADLKEKMANAKSIVFVDFRGLTVADDTRLRKLFRDSGVEYKVVKNTLAQRAVSELGWRGLEDLFQGPTAIALSRTDPVAPAKVLRAFVTETPVIKVKGGVLEGQRLTEERIAFLATLPPREELLARVAGAFKGPIASLATVLNGPLGGFARALNALREKKAGAGA